MKGGFTGATFVPGRGWNVVIDGTPTVRFYVDILSALSDVSSTVEARIRAQVGQSGRVTG